MKIILRREDYDGANMSQDHCCVDCGCNTAPGMPTRAEVEAMFAVWASRYRSQCQEP